MKKNLKISLLALTCFGLSASNTEVSQADFIKKVGEAVTAYNKDKNAITFENSAYLAAALYQSKDSSLKIFLGAEPNDKHLVINSAKNTLIVKGTVLEGDNILKTAMKSNNVEEKDLISTVEEHVKTSETKPKSNKKWWIIGGIVGLVVVAGVGYYFYSQNQSVDI